MPTMLRVTLLLATWAAAAADVNEECHPAPEGACYLIEDEADCLSSRDTRDDFRDSPCAWCGGEECIPGGARTCEPRVFLLQHQDEAVKEYRYCGDLLDGSARVAENKDGAPPPPPPPPPTEEENKDGAAPPPPPPPPTEEEGVVAPPPPPPPTTEEENQGVVAPPPPPPPTTEEEKDGAAPPIPPMPTTGEENRDGAAPSPPSVLTTPEDMAKILDKMEQRDEEAPQTAGEETREENGPVPPPPMPAEERPDLVAPAPQGATEERPDLIAPAPQDTMEERPMLTAPAPQGTTEERPMLIAPGPQGTTEEKPDEENDGQDLPVLIAPAPQERPMVIAPAPEERPVLMAPAAQDRPEPSVIAPRDDGGYIPKQRKEADVIARQEQLLGLFQNPIGRARGLFSTGPVLLGMFALLLAAWAARAALTGRQLREYGFNYALVAPPDSDEEGCGRRAVAPADSDGEVSGTPVRQGGLE